MAIPPISSSAIQGIKRATQGIQRNAADIASAGPLGAKAKSPTKNLVRSMVELHQHNQQASASVKAFSAADRVIGSLLDTKA